MVGWNLCQKNYLLYLVASKPKSKTTSIWRVLLSYRYMCLWLLNIYNTSTYILILYQRCEKDIYIKLTFMTGRVTLVSGFLSNIFSIRSFMPGEIAGLKKKTKQCLQFLFFIFFSVRLLLVLRVHSFFHPRHNGQWPPTSKDFYTRSYPLHYFLILILENPGPPALEASTIPLGYRGGGLTNSVYRLDSEGFTINIGYMKLTPILLILVQFIIQLGRPPA